MADEKVLRVGVVQGVTVIEERLVRTKGAVTFGTDAGCTFSFPSSDLPPSLVVFDAKDGGVDLVFADGAHGQVEREGEGGPKKLVDLMQGATKDGDSYRVAIPDTARGRIKISNEVMVLFHFVAPPPVGAAAELPLELKVSWVKSFEPIFTACLLASFVVHSAFGVFINVVEPPKPPDMEDLRKIVEQMTPPKVEAQKVDIPTTGPADTDDKGGKDDGKGKKGKDADSGGESAGKQPAGEPAGGAGKGGGGGTGPSRAEIRQQLAGKGILALIGGRGGGCGDGGGAVGSVFGTGSAISDDIGTALQGTSGVGIAGAGGGDVTRRGTGGGGGGCGGGCGGAAEIGAIGSSGGGPVDTGQKEQARIVARVQADDIEMVDGKVDKKSVQATIRRRAEAFQACYVNALKANSKLQGKIVVEFTIGENGRVVDARVAKDGLGSAEVANCVLSTMKRITFAAPEDGEVTISNSFVFQPGG